MSLLYISFFSTFFEQLLALIFLRLSSLLFALSLARTAPLSLAHAPKSKLTPPPSLALSHSVSHTLTHSLSMRASALSSAFEKYLSDIFLLLLYFYYFCFISFCVDCAADCVNASARVQGSERYAGADDAFALHLATSLARSHVGHGCCCCR